MKTLFVAALVIGLGLFWDSFHPTARMNIIFAADFARAVQAVPEPSMYALTGLGVALLTIVIRQSSH